MSLESKDLYMDVGAVRPLAKVVGDIRDVYDTEDKISKMGFMVRNPSGTSTYFRSTPDFLIVNGLQYVTPIRISNPYIRIIALVDRQEESQAFDAGVDICVRKDESQDSLALLSRNMLRREDLYENPKRAKLVKLKRGIVVDPSIGIAYKPKDLECFTPIESKVLASLVMHGEEGQSDFDIIQLTKRAKAGNADPSDNSKVIINRLRKKLPYGYILTKDSGYQFNPVFHLKRHKHVKVFNK